MCSIAGALLFNTQDSQKILAKKTIEKIITQTSNRGPDAKGFFSQDVGQSSFLALGHARLAIVDLNERSNQPLTTKNNTIVFNGEIYNHKALRKQLEGFGYQFSTNSDTEVLSLAFHHWGQKCLEKLDGIFAFAIFTPDKQELFCARDRFGVKPFFFAQNQNGFYFASSAKALLNWADVPKTLSGQGLWHYFTLMAFPEPFTPFENIYSLPAGHCAIVKLDRQVKFERWYKLEEQINSLSKTLANISFKEACQKVLFLLEKSIEKRISGEVPSGVFLSGGLDSSLICALSAEKRELFFNSTIHSFNLSFQFDPKNSEHAWAEMVAKKFGLDHHTLVATESTFKTGHQKMLSVLDCPVSDPVNIPFLMLSELAKSRGVKVIFVGEGADELFGGYNWYFKMDKVEGLLKKWSNKTTSWFLSKALGWAGKEFWSEICARHLDGQELFWTSANLFNADQKLELTDPERGSKGSLAKLLEQFGILDQTKNAINRPFEQNKIVSQIYPYLEQGMATENLVAMHAERLKRVTGNRNDRMLKYSYIDFSLRIPSLLMSRVDQMSMAHSLEVREPFLDTALVEFALALPERVRLQNNARKPILKEILAKYFDKEFINRQKIGFHTPISKSSLNSTCP